MLRESSTIEGKQIDLQVVTSGRSITGAFPAEAELIRFVEAALGDDTEGIRLARNSLQKEVGTEAMIDAAAVIANFQRVVVIADGTGLPLDKPIALVTVGLRESLGINEYSSARHTPKLGRLMRLIGSGLSRILPFLLKRIAK